MADEILDDIDFGEKDSNISKEDLENYIGLFIGARVNAYINHWKNPRIIAFDFLKMMIGIPWFLFRKMYGLALLLTMLVVFLCGINNVFFIVPAYGFSYLIFEYESISFFEMILYSLALSFVMIICGFFHEKIYLRYAENTVLKIYQSFFDYGGVIKRVVNDVEYSEDEDLRFLLKKKGGSSGLFPTAVLLVLLFYLLSRVSSGMNTILIF